MLHDLGVDVVAIDQSNSAAGLPLARRLGVRTVIGAVQEEETLRAAGITTCEALVSVTNSDIANLETALHARELATEPRIVIRLYDDDLAAYVQARISKTVSRSTSYLAAPEFAAAVLDHQVLRTIAVGRRLLATPSSLPGTGSSYWPPGPGCRGCCGPTPACRRPGDGRAERASEPRNPGTGSRSSGGMSNEPPPRTPRKLPSSTENESPQSALARVTLRADLPCGSAEPGVKKQKGQRVAMRLPVPATRGSCPPGLTGQTARSPWLSRLAAFPPSTTPALPQQRARARQARPSGGIS